MDELSPAADDEVLQPLRNMDLALHLDEAEADETAGRMADGAKLVQNLRRRADEVQARMDRRRV